MTDFYQWHPTGLLLFCQIQASASTSAIIGPIDAASDGGRLSRRLKIRLAAAPVDGKANAELVALLAKTFAVSKAAVVIVKGQQNTQKTVLINEPTQLPPDLDIH